MAKPPKTDLAGEIPEGPMIPRKTIAELVNARTTAKDFVKSYGDAITAQAEKYKIKKGALRKYIAAVEADKEHDLDSEVHDIEKLLEIET